MFGLLSLKTTLNLWYKCKLQERFFSWWLSSVTATVVFLGIGKFSSQVFFLFLTPLMRPYIIKMTWSCPKMPCPRFVFYWVLTILANAATRFCFSVIALAVRGIASITDLPGTLLSKLLYSFNWSDIRNFYVENNILRIFYCNTISLICTVFLPCAFVS